MGYIHSMSRNNSSASTTGRYQGASRGKLVVLTGLSREAPKVEDVSFQLSHSRRSKDMKVMW
jgi:hypothetical protein